MTATTTPLRVRRRGVAGALAAASATLMVAFTAYAFTMRPSALWAGGLIALAVASLPAIRRDAPVGFTRVLAALWFVATALVLFAALVTGSIMFGLFGVPLALVGALLLSLARRSSDSTLPTD